MNIKVVQLPETVTFTDRFKSYTITYPNSYPVHVRRVWNCNQCGIAVGSNVGKRVYGNIRTKHCDSCKESKDPVSLMCLATTGMSDKDFQNRFRRAWND